MAIKRYSRREPMVFIWIMIPYIIFMNLLIFGGCIFQSVGCFFKSFGISTLYFSIVYGFFGSVAVVIRNRYSAPGELFLRVRVMLPVFFAMNILAVYGVFYFYDWIRILECQTGHERIWWTILYGCIMSTLITFINEGMANWEDWKSSLAEGEKLKNAYQRSKLLGLKGQINPHFLFNCFNTLSGLIQENEEDAEKFLNEMTKVHRYLLRGDDAFLVSLSDEMKFTTSYLYLTKARFGESIQLHVNLPPSMMSLRIPPLSMQVILENIIYTNALSKKEPLTIWISTEDQRHLVITHTLHEKIIVQNLNLEEGLDNLITKYRLLNAEEIRISESGSRREIVLPLFDPNLVTA